MGRFMIPVCCICGRAAKRWHDPEWEAAGGLQDFCPDHALPGLVETCVYQARHEPEAP